MQIDTVTFLRLVENASTLCSFDLEATGLRGDYNSILCGSIKPYGKNPGTLSVTYPGRDKSVVMAIRDELEKYDGWITYYGRDFDVKLLNTRLLNWGERPLEKRPHIDMYWQMRSHTLTARRSLGHLVTWLRLQEEKMSVSADDWNAVLGGVDADSKKAMAVMVKRCESDTRILEDLYRRCKHLIIDIRK